MANILYNPWYLVTLFGAPELWAILTAILFGAYLAFRTGNIGGKKVKELLMLLVPALIITLVVVASLKGYFNVPRDCIPCITELVGCNPYCPIDSSLPSGHSATAFMGFTVLWLYKKANRKLLPLFIVPTMVAVSRIMLGVHTWVDVFSGAIIGITLTLLVWEIYKRI